MSDAAFFQILTQVESFSYEQKKSLIERLKISLKSKKNAKEFKIHLVKGKKDRSWIVDSLVGICPYPEKPYNDPKLERIMTKYESLG